MRRRAKPAKPKVDAKLPVAHKSLRDEASKRRELEKRLAASLEREKATSEILQEKDRALIEALEQQTATSEILRVISSSPTDAQPVFDAIVKSAVRLCGGLGSSVFRFDGELIHFVAHHNFTPEGLEAFQQAYPLHPAQDNYCG
jgi:hypothetical protein